MHRVFRTCLLTMLLLLPFSAFATGESIESRGIWVLVDTDRQQLEVYDGQTRVTSFPGIAIGRNGASRDRVRGDETTPLGEFRIGWINRESRFHIFLGFDYPTFHHASRAYASGRLPLDDYLEVADAVRLRRLPPQSTSLGGNIGIHGLGQADPDLHRIANWTQGCIALTDSEIAKLAELVTIGTRVIVR